MRKRVRDSLAIQFELNLQFIILFLGVLNILLTLEFD